MTKPSAARIKTFLLDAAITLAVLFAVQYTAAGAYNAFLKVRWVFQVISRIDELGPEFIDVLPPPPDKGKDTGKDLPSWIRANLPRAGAADYREVGEIFIGTAEKIRRGELDGKRQAYAATARELIRTVDRETWAPFVAALTARQEAETAESNAELADLFEKIGKAIKGEAAAAFEPEPEQGGRIA